MTIETHVWLARVGICVDIAARAQLTTARAASHDDQVLRVGNVDFTTDTLIALLSLLRTNEVIVEFDCQNPRLFSRQEDTTKHVARVLELNRTLRALNLGKCAVGDDGAVLLADALRFNGALCSLSLACNSIGAMGAEALATLILEVRALPPRYPHQCPPPGVNQLTRIYSRRGVLRPVHIET